MDNNQNGEKLFFDHDDVFSSSNSNSNDNIVINGINPQPIVYNNQGTSNASLNSNYDQGRINELKAKEKNNKPVIYTDGLDEDINYKKSFKDFFTKIKF